MHVCSQMDCWFMHFANVAYLSACSCMLACCKKKQVLYAQHNLTYLPTTIMHEKQCWLTLLILSPTQNTSNIGELVKHDQCIPPPAGGQQIQISLQGNLKLQFFTLSLMHLVTFGILTFGILTFGILTFVTFVAT